MCDSSWGNRNHSFFEDVATDRFWMLQWISPCLHIYEQHQLDLETNKNTQRENEEKLKLEKECVGAV